MNKKADDRPQPAGSSLSITLYMSPPHACAYLPEREAVTQFIDPAQSLNTLLYSRLVDSGFRRSGEYVYRPRCTACRACIPARIPVNAFRPSRGQRRAWQRNQDLEISFMPADFRDEHFALYRRYIGSRHPGGGMDVTDPDRYREFLLSTWSDTWCFEFRLRDRLLAVAVVDRLQRGLSAVYTYYDPDCAERGLGNFAILWEIAAAQKLGLPWLYLGYWIQESPKMSYKSRYRPLEILRDGLWQSLVPR
jgi:arginyl-tRNA--protein-N-Asp/Glu arginylyltransferase